MSSRQSGVRMRGPAWGRSFQVALAALGASAAIAVFASPAPAIAPFGAPSATAKNVPGEVVVRFKRQAPRTRRVAALKTVEARVVGALRREPLRLLRLPRGTSVASALRRLERSAAVAYAEPNRILHAFGVSNDPYLSEQYSLHNFGQLVGGNVTGTADADMDVLEAWDLTTGSSDVLVAVADGGIAYDNPELAANLFVNPGESGAGRETNGVDDDANGFVDDFRGWDFTDDDNDPRDLGLFPHGTVSSSVIGALGSNGTGVSGVAQHVRILPLRVFDIDGVGNTFTSAQAFEYAGAMRAPIVNASFGGSGFSQAQSDAIGGAPDTLFVAAAGNDGTNNDTSPVHPCNDPHPNVVCVAATDESDQLADFSNFGATQVDLAAPGVGVIAAAPSFASQFSDGFEQALAGRWVSGGTNDSWARTNAAFSSGSFSLTDSPDADYVNNTNSFIRTVNSFSLAGKEGCRVDFQLRLDTEEGVDGIIFEASTDATNWTELTGFSGSSGGDFLGLDADLTAFQGQTTVYLRLLFISDASITGDGVYVDDLAINCMSSSYDGDELIYANGTSFSAPNVAGIAALALSLAPDLPVAELRRTLLDGVDPLPALAGTTVTGGRANALETLSQIKPGATTEPPTDVGGTVATLHGTVQPRGQATGFAFEYGTTTAYGSRTPDFDGGDAVASQPVGASIGGLSPNQTYHFRIVATNGAGTTTGADQTLTTGASPTGAAVDRTAPAASGARVTVSRSGKATLAFSATEAATFVAVVSGQSGQPRSVRAREVGAADHRLNLGRLAPGTYVAVFTLRDSTGNRSSPVTARFTVRNSKPRKKRRPNRGRSATQQGAPQAAAASVSWLAPIGAGGGAPGYKVPSSPAPVEFSSPPHTPAVVCGGGGCKPVLVSTCPGGLCVEGPDPNAPKPDDPFEPADYRQDAPITESRREELFEIQRFLEAQARKAEKGSREQAVAGLALDNCPHPLCTLFKKAREIGDVFDNGSVGSGSRAEDLRNAAELIEDELEDKKDKVVPDGTPGAVPAGTDVTQLPDLGRDHYRPREQCGVSCSDSDDFPPFPPHLVPSPYRPPKSSSVGASAGASALRAAAVPGLSAKGRRAIRDLTANLSASAALRRAVRRSAAAASAAARTGNRVALDRNALLTRVNAARLVSLLSNEPRLRRKAAAALRRYKFKLSVAEVRAVQRRVERRGLPAGFRKLAARAGVNSKRIARSIVRADAKTLTGSFPALISNAEAKRAAFLDAHAYATLANVP